MSSIQKCKTCRGDLITDQVTMEINCNRCGIVIEESVATLEFDERSFEGQPSKSRTGGKLSNKFYDMGLSSVIGASNTDAMGNKINGTIQRQMNQLRKWDNRSKKSKSKDKSLFKALTFLNHLEDILALPVNVVEETSSIYRQLLDRNMIRGRNMKAMMSACVFHVCKNNSIPLSIKEIANLSSLIPKDVSRYNTIICQELELKTNLLDPRKNIYKLASKLHLDENITNSAYNILTLAKEEGKTAGKNPTGLVASAIYLASSINGLQLTQRKICLAADITEATIRNNNKNLKKILIKNPQYMEKIKKNSRHKL